MEIKDIFKIQLYNNSFNQRFKVFYGFYGLCFVYLFYKVYLLMYVVPFQTIATMFPSFLCLSFLLLLTNVYTRMLKKNAK